MYYHFSEDPTITHFKPRLPDAFPGHPPVVWAIDVRHAPLYFLPRDCPRVAFWRAQDSSEEDIKRYLSYTEAKMVIVVESDWLSAIRKTKLYRYTFSPEHFSCFDINAGYYISTQCVTPISVEPMGDLIERLIEANVEIRFTSSLHLLHEEIAASTLSFSMIRMRNAKIRKN